MIENLSFKRSVTLGNTLYILKQNKILKITRQFWVSDKVRPLLIQTLYLKKSNYLSLNFAPYNSALPTWYHFVKIKIRIQCRNVRDKQMILFAQTFIAIPRFSPKWAMKDSQDEKNWKRRKKRRRRISYLLLSTQLSFSLSAIVIRIYFRFSPFHKKDVVFVFH